jgi:predicted enzyme related to lactoylglutathione lyase
VTAVREGFPPGVPCWVDTAHRDRDAALAFYGDVFGWSFDNRMASGAEAYDVAHVGGRDVAAVWSGPDVPVEAAWNTYVCVESADVAVDKVKGAGGALGFGPAANDAGTMAVFTDPAGAPFRIWQPGTHSGAELVNEPGTWNWSILHTPDPAQAAAFYGEVFGWEVDLADGAPSLVRLPGYADFLERFDPGLRQRHADYGAPEGFSDAVGWIVADEGPPCWKVTFSVADADVVATIAERAGGSVATPPHDTE